MPDASLLVPMSYDPGSDEWKQWMDNLYFTMKQLSQNGDQQQITGALIAALAQTPGAFSSLQNFGTDALAAAGGIPVGALYRRGNVVVVRVV